MSDEQAIREQLIGYLLGALEPDEQKQVEERLVQDAQLRQELEALRHQLLPLAEDDEEPTPPRGLAAKTCGYVMDRLGPAPGQFGSACEWRMHDLLVAGGLFIAASLLVFPAVLNSRETAQLRVCQSNLGNLGRALSTYSDLHQGYFPRVPTRGNLAVAGVYAPILVDCGLVDSHTVVCPASPIAKDEQFRVPTLAEVQLAQAELLRRMQQRMGGSYGYSFGYVENGRYHAVRNRQRATFAIMSDAPDVHQGSASVNHGGRGQNVLFEDGHVRLLKSCQLIDCGDHIYQNGLGYVGAGIGSEDAVIGASSAAPVVLHTTIEH